MYERILVPVDGSATSRRGLQEAIALAKLTHARLRLLHVVDELSLSLALDPALALNLDWLGTLRKEGQRILQEAGDRVRAEGIEVDGVLVEDYQQGLAQVVARDAVGWHADLIVLGSHGRRGVGRMFLGSDAEQIVRIAPVPVLLVRAAPGAAAP